MTNTTNTTTNTAPLSAEELDKLEVLARAANGDDSWRYYTSFQEALTPIVVIDLIAQARAATAVSVEDAARLDFLDTNVHRFRMGWEVGAAPVGNLSVRSIIMGGKPIREAIDAAMSATQEGK